MAGKAADWNVVVVGSWNLAILTPAGITQRLFGLKDGETTIVELPLEAPGPYRVSHNGVTVVPSPGRLEVVPRESTNEGLVAAAEIAARAVSALPETLFQAAGVNIRFRFDSVPDVLVRGSSAAADSSRPRCQTRSELARPSSSS